MKTREHSASHATRVAAQAEARTPRFATRVVARRLWRNATVLALVAIVAAGALWMYTGVEGSLRELRAQGLPALLEAKTKSLEVLIAERRNDAERWAGDPRLAAATLELARSAQRNRRGIEELCRGEAAAEWRELLAPILSDDGVVAVNAVDADGRIIASTLDRVCGLEVRPRTVAPRLGAVFGGRTQFIRPFAADPELVAAQPFLDARPLAWIETPVRDEKGVVVMALGFAIYVDSAFRDVLSAARPGRTGEAYAFDENGVLLSEIRSPLGLRAAGLIPRPGTAGTTFRMKIRDPGVELHSGGGTPAGKPDEWPLTRPVAAALAAANAPEGAPLQGVLLDPYRNYRGAEVIGAWRWLRDEQIGIVVEMGIEEAYAPLRYVRYTLAGAFGLIVLTAAWAGWSTLALWRLKRSGVAGGRRIGAYRLEREIAEGGMASIHLARHALLKRPTAVKILKRHLATDEQLARFEREVRLASSLEHPNTVEIYDYGHTPDGLFYYTMEYIDGLSLDELVAREGPPPLGRTRHIVRQICAALTEVHGKGMVHRDIKPANVMLTERGGEYDFVKLLDFGIVKRVGDGGPFNKPDDARLLTQQLRLLGTPTYMAPERIGRPSDVDARADIYGVGAILFHLATGRPPFTERNQAALLREVLSSTAPRAATLAGGVPEALDALIAACLAKSPADRPADVSAVVATLDALDLPPWTRDDARAWWLRWRGRGEARGAKKVDAGGG